MRNDSDLRPTSGTLSRRDLIALGAGVFVVGALPFAARRRGRLYRRTLPVMGTLAEVAVVERDPRRARRALNAAFAELVRVDRTMSRFRADSEVGRLNAAAGRRAVPVSSDTAAVLRAALGWARKSCGAFDPCLGRAAALWDVVHRARPPRPEELRPLGGGGLYRALDLDGTGPVRARLEDPRAAVDLGGIAKGYAVDLAVRALRERGIEQALVNAGGDLYALGRSEDGDPWRVGVRDPADPGRLCATLEVADAAVATSGDYERNFRYRGRLYHHLLDPRTAQPVETRYHSVTVRAPDCLTADAAATTAFTLGPDRAAPLLDAVRCSVVHPRSS